MKKIVKKRQRCKEKAVSGRIKKATSAVIATILLLNVASFAPDAATAKTVRLGGQPFGVRFYNSGVMVVEFEPFLCEGRYQCPARDAGLEINDVICKADDTPISTNEELQRAACQSGGEALKLSVRRGDKELVKTVLPRRADDGVYRTGAWVRDSSAGIGTVTYYDEQNGCFAALGHGVCDRDTGALLPLGSAEVVSAEIGSVTKSSTGKAGSLNGVFCDTEIGDLTKNTVCGVFGTTNDNFPQNGAELEIADNEEIELGKALIYTTVDGAEPCCYEAEITRLCDLDSQTNENFVIKVTDDRLIRDCGGIVQGMSGSPVVQNNKLVGAVTHVFLNSPHEGYGVTAQNMVSNYQK